MSDDDTLLSGESQDTAVFDDESRYLDRFGLLLCLVVTVIVIASLIHLPHPSDLVTNIGVLVLSAVMGLILLLAIHASGVSARWRRVFNIVIGVFLTVQLAAGAISLARHPPQQELGMRVPPVVALLFACLSFWLVVRRLVRQRQVTEATVVGAIAGYLLIPIIFFDIFLSMEIVLPGTFFTSTEASPEFMYYSLTTITTLGSPLTAGTDLGRLLTAAASIIGQLYLVVFVALIVGNLAGRWAQHGETQE